MAYGVKYRIEYDDVNDITTRIDLLEDGYSSSITELTAGVDPFKINYPDFGKNIFKTMQGGGATINVMATNSDDLTDLYTNDPVKYQVRVYKGGTSTSDIFWFGFLNSEVFSDTYTEYTNYSVTLEANDGIGVLKRYKYLDGSDNYTGNNTIFEVLQEAYDKLGLDLHNIGVASEIEYSGYIMVGTDTVLENLDINNTNYYDEQGEPMTFYQVIEGVLGGLGLTLKQYDGSWIIIDPLLLMESSYYIKWFDTTTFAYDTYSNINPSKTIGTDVEWFKTGAQRDMVAGFNELTLKYSGYAPDAIIYPEYWTEDYARSAGSWVLDYDNKYWNTTWGGIDNWSTSNEGSWYARKEDDEGYYAARIDRTDPDGNGTGNLVLTYTGTSEQVRYCGGQYMQVSFDIYGNVDESGVFSKNEFYGISMRMKIKVGSYYWNGNSWTTTDTTFMAQNSTKNVISESWYEFTLSLPIWSSLAGEPEVSVYEYFYKLDKDGSSFSNCKLDIVYIKNINMVVTNLEGEKLDNDYEHTAKMDSNYLNPAPKINIINGDSYAGVATHKGGYIASSTNQWATNFKDGTYGYTTLQELLLAKYMSQYESRMQINGALTGDDIYYDLSPLVNITDTHTGAKKFILVGGSYHDQEQYIDAKLLEIKANTITI